MEKKSNFNEPDNVCHFGHPHPLHLNGQPPTAACSVCELKSGGRMYSCNPCKFTVHTHCASLRSGLVHPSHPHPLALLARPAYSSGGFICSGCRESGCGFNYHCNNCNFDLHISCAVTPSSITHQSHPPHVLKLVFQVPYIGKAFICNICGKIGHKKWVYRCDACRFDAHLKCAMGWTRTKTTTEAATASTSSNNNRRRSEVGNFAKQAAFTAGKIIFEHVVEHVAHQVFRK